MSSFKYNNIHKFIKQALNPYVTNIVLLLNDIKEIIRTSVPIGSIINWPVTSNPAGFDQGKWLECNGQLVPKDSSYDTLRQIVGTYVPDYSGYFLRCATSSGQIGTKVNDTISRHNHSFSGTAEGQKYFDMKSGQGGVNASIVQGSSEFRRHVEKIFGSSINSTRQYTQGTDRSGWCGNVNIVDETSYDGDPGHTHSIRSYGNRVTGTPLVWIVDGGYDYAEDSNVTGTIGNYGSDETAPKHIYIRYLIKAKY